MMPAHTAIVDEGFDALLRTGEVQDQRLIARPLAPLRWIRVAAPDYLARFGTPQRIDELRGHNCITVRNLRNGRRVDWQFMLDGKVQDVSVEGQLIFDIGDAMVYPPSRQYSPTLMAFAEALANARW